MGNDMTWEQKCRISALRAACASQYDFRYVKDTDDVIGAQPESDEELTARILARAETFRIALLADGALDYEPGEEDLPESNVCPMCGASSRKMPLQVAYHDGIPEICRHKWHQE